MNYRNKKLLESVREAPECFICGTSNDGTVVAAHSNQQRDGKGVGIKAHDYRIAAVCYRCHAELDQGKNWGKQERRDLWEEAHRNTVGWLFGSGILQVTKKG
jgi:hypothetical protein